MTPTEILPFFLLIFAVGIAIGWMLGNNHGIEIGREIGAADEILASRQRCIQHKRDSFKLGQVVTVGRLLNGEPPFPNPLRDQSRSAFLPRAEESRPEGKTARQMPVSARNTFNHS